MPSLKDAPGVSSSPMVSVVIPVFNAERYIGECVKSLQAQTMRDFEILAVDNGSTDASVAILRDMAEGDSRITVLSSEGNAGVARNVGMEVARGKYLLFLDADDFFAPELLQDTVAAAEEKQAQLVLFGGRRFDDAKQEVLKKFDFLRKNLLPKQEVFSARDCGIDFFRITTPAPWSKLFLRSFIEDKGLKFQSLQNSNDVFFTMAAMAMADRIVAVKEDLIRYRVNMRGSLQGSKSRNPLCFVEALSALGEYLRASDRYDVLKPTYQQQVLSTVKYNLETSTTGKARLEILDAIEETGLVRPNWQQLIEGDAEDSYAAYLYAFVSAALAQRRREKAMKRALPPSSRLVVAPRDGKASVTVSVVIPVYNTAEYISQTIACMLNQTLDDLEVICIDDGSNDGTLEILLEEAEKDPRISVFTQENSGQSASRNVGMTAARGKYLYFIDSDDLLDEQALELCCKAAERDNLDMFLFDATSFYESEKLHSEHAAYDTYYTRARDYEEVMDGPHMMVAMAKAGDYLPSPCLYIAKTDYVRGIDAAFIPGIFHEDNAYTYDLMIKASRVSHRKLPLYRRRIRENSTMTSRVTFSHCYGYYACGKQMLKTARELSGELDDETYAAVLRIAYGTFANAQARYNNLAKGEEGGTMGMTAVERASFDTLVGKDSSGAKVNRELTKVKDSRPYRLGWKLTKPYRDLKKKIKG